MEESNEEDDFQVLGYRQTLPRFDPGSQMDAILTINVVRKAQSRGVFSPRSFCTLIKRKVYDLLSVKRLSMDPREQERNMDLSPFSISTTELGAKHPCLVHATATTPVTS